MKTRQIKRFEVAAEINDKALYEIGEEMALRTNYSPEPIDGINLAGLDYILFLDRQEYSKIMAEINKKYDYIQEIGLHYKEVRDYRDGLLNDMEEKANQFENDCYNESADRHTPCDDPEIGCPYDACGGDDCRRYCGLGVDE